MTTSRKSARHQKAARAAPKTARLPREATTLDMGAFRYPDSSQPEILDAQPAVGGTRAGGAPLFSQADGDMERRALQSFVTRREAEAEAAKDQQALAAWEADNQRIKSHRDEFDAAPWYAKVPMAAQDVMGIGSDAATFGAMKYPIAVVEAAFSDEAIDQRLKAYDENMQAAYDRAGMGAAERPKPKAMRDLEEGLRNQKAQAHRDEFNAAPWYIKAPVAVQDIMGITADSATFGAMKYPVAALEAATSDETFDQRLRAYDDNLQAAYDRAGYAGTAAQLVGGIATGAALEKSGWALASNTVAKNMPGFMGHAVRGGRGAIDGAVQGFAEAVFRGEPIGRGTLTGAVSGLGGSVTNDLAFPAANPVTRVNHDPLDFIDVANGLAGYRAGEAAGRTYDSVKDYLADSPRKTRAYPNPVWQNRERY